MYYDAIGERGEAAPAGSEARASGLTRSIDVRELWPPIYRARYAILGIMIGVLSLGVVATLLIRPLYRAAATVEIRQEAQKVLGTEDQNENGSSDGDRFLNTQLNIIKSRSTAVAVAQSLNLANNQRFLESIHIKSGPRGFAGSQDDRFNAAVGALRGNLATSFSKDTRIAQIEYSSPDAGLAAQVANSFADSYIRLNLDRRFDASRYSLQFLRGQIAAAQARLAESERGAIRYARQSRLIDASDAAGQSGTTGARSLTTASLVQMNQALSEAVARRITGQNRWEKIRGTPLLSVPEVLSNGMVQSLIGQKASLQAQYQLQLQTRREDYPAVRQLAAQISELNRQIGVVGTNVRNVVRTEYERSAAEEQALRRGIEGLKTRTLDEQSRGIQLSILQREATTNRQQLDSLLTRYNEVNAQSGVQTNNLSLIDRADIPGRPYWPNLPLNLGLAVVLGLILSALYVIGRESLFEMVRTPKDVTDRLHLPSLGAVPVAEDVLGELQDSKSVSSESFSTIRTALSLSSSSGVPKSLMFTSTQAGEGKSTACYGLAVSLAKIGRRVVIVDADLRRPNVHRLFGLKNGTGLSNTLASEIGAADVVHRQLVPGIDVITAGPIPPNPAELLATARLAQTVAELESQYDHVLVDSAPVLGLADAPLVAVSARAIVFVVESARTSVRGAVSAINRLTPTERPILGAVLSRFDPGRHGYTYDYKYEYNYSYGSNAKA